MSKDLNVYFYAESGEFAPGVERKFLVNVAPDLDTSVMIVRSDPNVPKNKGYNFLSNFPLKTIKELEAMYAPMIPEKVPETKIEMVEDAAKVEEPAKLTKKNFFQSLRLVSDDYVKDERDKKTLQRIINKVAKTIK